MLEKYTFVEQDHTDLSVANYGIEDCAPQHSWVPGIRDRYIIHIITAGSGSFTSRSVQSQLTAGQAFLITPGDIVHYQADSQDPWSYIWIGFHGLRAESLCRLAGLSARHPVVGLSGLAPYQEWIQRLLQVSGTNRTHDLRRTGLLYEFMAMLCEEPGGQRLETGETIQSEYLRQAIQYIAANYARPLAIGSLAAHVGLDRSYLYSIFRKYLNVTPKAFLTQYRMVKASELLATPLTISEVAQSVGYDDALLFSKVFKKEKGIPPSQYRTEQAKIQRS